MARHRIDDAPKLLRHLEEVERETFAISSHTRFASAADGEESISISVKSFHVPEVYEDFYKFCFDFLKEADQEALTRDDALVAWDLILVDHLPIGQKFVNYVLNEGGDLVSIDRDLWLHVLDFCKTVHITEANGKSVFTGYDGRVWPEIIAKYVDSVRRSELAGEPAASQPANAGAAEGNGAGG